MKSKSLILAGALLALAGTDVAKAACAAPCVEVLGSAALEGSFGLAVNIAGTADTYVESDHPSDETHYLYRFRLNASNLTMPASTSFRMIRTNNSNVGSEGQNIIHFIRRGDDGVSNRFQTWVKDGDGVFKFVGGFFIGTNQARQIEVEWTRSGAGLNNGTIRVTRLAGPGAEVTVTRNNLTNETHDIDRMRIGSFTTDFPVGSSGTYLFDSFESYR